MDRLPQAALRRAGTDAGLSWPLHPTRRHRQLPADQHGRRSRRVYRHGQGRRSWRSMRRFLLDKLPDVVHRYLRRARLAGLSWPLPEGMDYEGLELLLFPAPKAASQSPRRPVPDWSYAEMELRRRNVTRVPLWEEYRAAIPPALATLGFVPPSRPGKGARPAMRQTHVGGERDCQEFCARGHDGYRERTSGLVAFRAPALPYPGQARAPDPPLAEVRVVEGLQGRRAGAQGNLQGGKPPTALPRSASPADRRPR